MDYLFWARIWEKCIVWCGGIVCVKNQDERIRLNSREWEKGQKRLFFTRMAKKALIRWRKKPRLREHIPRPWTHRMKQSLIFEHWSHFHDVSDCEYKFASARDPGSENSFAMVSNEKMIKTGRGSRFNFWSQIPPPNHTVMWSCGRKFWVFSDYIFILFP